MARENAYMILNQYFEDESFLNIALNEQLKKSKKGFFSKLFG